MLTRRALLRTALCLPSVLVLGAGCTSTSPGATAKLDYSWFASLGEAMTFRVTVYPRYDFPRRNRPPEVPSGTIQIYFSLDNGLAASEPLDPQWSVTRPMANHLFYYRPVTLIANIPQTAELPVRLDQPGDFEVRAGACELFQTSPFQAAHIAEKILYLRVTSAGTQIQDTPFQA